MTSRFHNPVMTSERRRMLEMLSVGMTRREIAKTMGRHENTVSVHVRAANGLTWPSYRVHRRVSEARRIERFFAACNQALASASHTQGAHP